MTQKNIEIMDIIVDKLAEGKTLAAALREVYTKRKVSIPYREEWLNYNIPALKMSMRTTGKLLRVNLVTIKDVVNYTQRMKITDIPSLGKVSGIELFERILNHCWDNMTQKEKTAFLIHTVEQNSDNIRPELV